MKDHTQRTIATLGDVMNWRAELRAEGIERRPSSNNNADRGYVEQPGEGMPDKPPPSVPRLPPHSQRPQSSPPLVLRRPVTSLTPAPPPSEPTLLDRVAAAAEVRLAQAPLPPPSAVPTEAPAPKSEQQTLVRLARPEPSKQEERQACGKRARRCHSFPDDFKAKVVARFRELGGKGAQRAVAREFDISQSVVSRWVRGDERAPKVGVTEMPKGKPLPGNAISSEAKDEWAAKAVALGHGGITTMAKKAKVSKQTMGTWVESYKARRSSQSTMVSSSPVSKVQSKPNGAATSAPAPLSGFLTGLDDYIAQLVDARVEAKLVEILKTKSLMDLMRQ